jgi:hypothetical protein
VFKPLKPILSIDDSNFSTVVIAVPLNHDVMVHRNALCNVPFPRKSYLYFLSFDSPECQLRAMSNATGKTLFSGLRGQELRKEMISSSQRLSF